MTDYQVRRPSTGTMLVVRGLRYHLRRWGPPDGRPLVLLHGGRDASPTFQFLVDALAADWAVIAPDWRGHGLSDWAPQGYWFQDYLADLDAILDEAFSGRAVPILGHSLGGNVACIYAGVRPARVSHLISLDGFGLPSRDPREAPDHLRRWLDAWRAPPSERSYPDASAMAERLRAANPRLGAAQALFLAEHISRPAEDGGRTWAFDPRHRLPFATLHRVAEWATCMARVTAPALWIGSGAVFPPGLERDALPFSARLALIPRLSFVRIEGAGHNLHHDAPDEVASLVEDFLGRQSSVIGHQ
jgi:pimeloyl-ACP methyl ester carboxylesterase